ncbi:unnamed protein product [Aspergillus oryzae var. brunneus]|uniref:Unnamed protein product n=2 Tax=Aspergillus oryzae TaxID=5062 RepID=A0AAN4YI26_ASPOZ|nr:unnamed protein product [Aspergillus oryzae]GMG49531.1 unnamed protein product [Aspergillus oryzae var. brunneus]
MDFEKQLSSLYQIQFPITYERRPNESPLFRLTPYANQTHNHLYLIKTTVGRRAIVELPKDIIDVETQQETRSLQHPQGTTNVPNPILNLTSTSDKNSIQPPRYILYQHSTSNPNR